MTYKKRGRKRGGEEAPAPAAAPAETPAPETPEAAPAQMILQNRRRNLLVNILWVHLQREC